MMDNLSFKFKANNTEIAIKKFQFVGNNNRTSSSVSQLATDLTVLNCNNARNTFWQIIIHPRVTKQMQSCRQPETAQLEVPLAFDSASWL